MPTETKELTDTDRMPRHGRKQIMSVETVLRMDCATETDIYRSLKLASEGGRKGPCITRDRVFSEQRNIPSGTPGSVVRS
jgi:hypothetical protein